MKKMLLFLTALAAWHGVAAQDVILLRNADEIKARVTEITETDVLCKMWDDPTKMLRIARAEVFSITYANGERELFAEEKSAAADYPWPAVTRSYRPGDLFDEDGVRGVVISTTDEGRHGLILSLGQARLAWAETTRLDNLRLGLSDRTDGWNNRRRVTEWIAGTELTWADFPAFEWCESQGEGWYMPAADELHDFWRLLNVDMSGKISFGDWNRARKRNKDLMESYGGDPGGMYSLLIWSSTEVSESASAICGNRDFYSPDKTEAGYPKAGQTCVRAVHKF